MKSLRKLLTDVLDAHHELKIAESQVRYEEGRRMAEIIFNRSMNKFLDALKESMAEKAQSCSCSCPNRVLQ